MILRLLLVLNILFLLISCSKEEPIYTSQKTDPFILYEEGYKAFESNDFFYANKKFDEAELNFENIDLAAKSAVMYIFSLYGINFYEEALENIKKFAQTYPADKRVIYVEYLKAVIFFEQINDEKKDLEPLLEANKQIDYFVKKYPNSDYTVDLRFKKDLIQNQLAAKELYNAKYYISVQKWIPAINRLKIIVKNYDKTIFKKVFISVEINYHLGLEEAKNYAKILGYKNCLSEWFEQSYKMKKKVYFKRKIRDKRRKKKDNIIKKIII